MNLIDEQIFKLTGEIGVGVSEMGKSLAEETARAQKCIEIANAAIENSQKALKLAEQANWKFCTSIKFMERLAKMFPGTIEATMLETFIKEISRI